MEPADGAAVGAVTIRSLHWRGALLGAGLIVVAGLLVLFAPSPAHADDGDSSGLLGGVVGEVTDAVDGIVSPVVAPLPSLRETPIVGGLVGQVVDTAPVARVTAPVADVVDGLLGDTVASLPVVGSLLGDRPVGGITTPVAGTFDDTLGNLVDGAGLVLPPVLFPHPDAPAIGAAAAFAAPGLTASFLPALALADGLGAIVAGAENLPFGGFASVPGDSMPISVVTASGPPGGLAAAVLGAGLLLLLLAGRLRPELFRAPPTPTFDTDSSPD